MLHTIYILLTFFADVFQKLFYENIFLAVYLHTQSWHTNHIIIKYAQSRKKVMIKYTLMLFNRNLV